MQFFWTIVALVVVLGLAWRFLGSYMAAVFEGRVHWLGWLERPVYWALGTSPEQEQTWKTGPTRRPWTCCGSWPGGSASSRS